MTAQTETPKTRTMVALPKIQAAKLRLMATLEGVSSTELLTRLIEGRVDSYPAHVKQTLSGMQA